MTTLTLVTVAVIAYGVLNRYGYSRALALGGATPAGAALVAGTTAVPTFYAAAIGAAIALALATLPNGVGAPRARQRFPPGTSLLVLFAAWSIGVTLLAPQLLAGARVLPAAGGDAHLIPGVLTSSNIAQIIYVVLSVCVVIFLARSPHAGPELIGLAVGTCTLLSLWRYTGAGFPEGLFDNSPSFNFIETAPGGVQRFRGILSEPAGLATASLVTISYMLPRAVALRGWRRFGALAIAGAAGYMGTISTSTTFVVAGGLIAVIALLTFVTGFFLRRTSVSELVSVVACAMVIVALFVLPIVFAFAQAAVDEKVSSSSYDTRSNSDSLAYEIFLDTFGFGTGVGSTRASSFLPGLLATTGLVGTLLFAAAVAGLLFQAAPIRAYRPVVWALVTVLVVKIVSGPDLSDSSGVIWMSLGLLSRAAQEPGARKPFRSLLPVPSARGRPADS
jgi:hypothetical protein